MFQGVPVLLPVYVSSSWGWYCKQTSCNILSIFLRCFRDNLSFFFSSYFMFLLGLVLQGRVLKFQCYLLSIKRCCMGNLSLLLFCLSFFWGFQSQCYSLLFLHFGAMFYGQFVHAIPVLFIVLNLVVQLSAVIWTICPCSHQV